MSTRVADFGPEDTDAPPAMPLVQQPVMDRLQAWAEQMQADIAHADAKASTLLGWSGTALAVVTTVMASVGLYVPQGQTWVVPVGGIGLASLSGCVIALVLVIRPRLGGRPLVGGYSYSSDERSFLTFASIPPADVIRAACQDTDAPGTDPTLAVRRVQNLALIALIKHRLIRSACTLLLISMPLLAVAGAAMALGLSAGVTSGGA